MVEISELVNYLGVFGGEGNWAIQTDDCSNGLYSRHRGVKQWLVSD